MANQDHLDQLKSSSIANWNHWRTRNKDINIELSEADLSSTYLYAANLSGAKLRHADLTGADLTGANLIGATLYSANFSGADLSKANLTGANLIGADLTGTKLNTADLNLANLSGANLIGAILSDATLKGANLTDANLSGADFTDTNLSRVNFSNAKLSGAEFSEAHLGGTVFFNTDLTGVLNLGSVNHHRASTVDHLTLEKSGILPAIFLRGCGLPDTLINYYPSLLNQPISFYSCFISYSHDDKAFARRLHDQLQGRGIRCWLDEHQLLPGDDIYDHVDQGIKRWDKVLLCASKSALTSWWVDNEIDAAFNKEQTLFKQRGEKVWSLIPLDLDGYMFEGEWNNGKAGQVKSRLAADFMGWEKDNDTFEAALEKTVKALQTNDTGREAPPIPKL